MYTTTNEQRTSQTTTRTRTIRQPRARHVLEETLQKEQQKQELTVDERDEAAAAAAAAEEEEEEDLEETFAVQEAKQAVSIHLPEASRSLWETVVVHPSAVENETTTATTTPKNVVSSVTTNRQEIKNGVRRRSNTTVPTFAFAYGKEEKENIQSSLEKRRDLSTVSNNGKSSTRTAVNGFPPSESSKMVSSQSSKQTTNNGKPAAANVQQQQQQQSPNEVRVDDDKEEEQEQEFDDNNAYQKSLDAQHRSMWKHRHARTAEEGIRRETTTTHSRLSNVLAKAGGGTWYDDSGRHYAARTIRGLIHALAEEVDGLHVQVKTRPDTPFWDKQIDAIKIQFSRLGFKPLRMGGAGAGAGGALQQQRQESSTEASSTTVSKYNKSLALSSSTSTSSSSSTSTTTKETTSSVEPSSSHLTNIRCVDEAFDRIDVDKSGALDSDEIAQALNLAALGEGGGDEDDSEKNKAMIQNLATDLVKLYDFNGDGVVDRAEYQSMVEDMAALREAHKRLQEEEEERQDSGEGMFSGVRSFVADFWAWFRAKEDSDTVVEQVIEASPEEAKVVFKSVSNQTGVVVKPATDSSPEIIDVSNSPGVVDSMAKTLGSITVSDLKIDLRRLIFGAVPILKHITPGGPLILEPFTVTVNGSFNRDDIMNSNLLDAGLRQLVARALRRRVGSLRDFIEGSVFKGRSWKLISGTGPVVRVPKLTNVEFDKKNRLIINGRARVQSRPDGPVIENAFKLRTKIGTTRGGRSIRLVEPELALMLECPNSLEEK